MLVRLADHHERLGDMDAVDGEMAAAEVLEMSGRRAVPVPRELGAFLKNVRSEVFIEFILRHLTPSNNVYMFEPL